jgi:hypothetical protein
MIRRISSLAAALAVVALTAAAPAGAAEAIPYDQYRPGKLVEVAAPTQDAAAGTVAISPDTNRREFHVKYTGDHRPISAATAAVIAEYIRAAHALPDVATCKEEYRFTEGGKDFWVPVEAATADEMTVEMSPGDSADLYGNVLGFYRQDSGWSPVIVVEEVQTPN